VVRDCLLIHCGVKPLFEAWLGEQSVDILKSESLGFCEKLVSSCDKHVGSQQGLTRVEEVHDGHPSCVQDGKDDVGSPLDVSDGGRSDVDDQEVHDPVRAGRDGRSSLAETERENFGGVDPDGGLEANGECTLEDEEHSCGTDTSAI